MNEQLAKDEKGNVIFFIIYQLDENNKITGDFESNIPMYLFGLKVVKKQLDLINKNPSTEEINKISSKIFNAVLERPELNDIILLKKYLNSDGSVNYNLYIDTKMQSDNHKKCKAFSINEEVSLFEDIRSIMYNTLGYPWHSDTKISRVDFESHLISEKNKLVYSDIFEIDLDYHQIPPNKNDGNEGAIWAGKNNLLLFGYNSKK